MTKWRLFAPDALFSFARLHQREPIRDFSSRRLVLYAVIRRMSALTWGSAVLTLTPHSTSVNCLHRVNVGTRFSGSVFGGVGNPGLPSVDTHGYAVTWTYFLGLYFIELTFTSITKDYISFKISNRN
jgi:hypothetical protein